MPSFIRYFFKKGGDHARLRPDGVYEIRLTYQGIAISASSKNPEIAKEKFLKRLREVLGSPDGYVPKRKKFAEFTEFWLDNVKKPTITPGTFNQIYHIYKKHLKPAFGNMPMKEITPMTIQPLFNRLLDEGIGKTAEECRKLLKQIFDAAVGERVIPFNPMPVVHILPHETKKGVPLTRAEEAKFLKDIEGSPYRLHLIVLLYTGVRRGELRSMHLEEGFISVACGKRRRGLPEKRRKIPITPMLRPYLPQLSDLQTDVNPNRLSIAFSAACPNHHLHELRHTFISRCRECGVPREIVGLWAGHTPDDITSRVYTEYSNEYILSFADMVKYDLLPKKSQE